ncbi:MAG: hypothetical protein AAF750_03820 [Planctomycetota bacterium]
MRPPLDDHPESKQGVSDDDRGWAAWLVIVLLAAVTLRGLMLVFGGGAAEVVAVFTGGEPAVVAPADRALPRGPIGVDAVAVGKIAAGMDPLASVGEDATRAATTPNNGYALLLQGAAQLGLPRGAVVAVQSVLALGLIVLAFAIGRRFGGHGEEDAKSADRVGLIAAALMAVHPAVLLAGASLEPTLWSTAGVLLAVYLLTGVGKTRVRADGGARRDWLALLTRSSAAGLAMAIAVAFGGVDSGLVVVLLAGLGVGLAWWVWQRERDRGRRQVTEAGENGEPAAPVVSGWRRHAGVFGAAVVSAGLFVGIGGVVPGVISSRGLDAAALVNDWQAGAATRLAWATHNPAVPAQADAGAALAMLAGEQEAEPDRSVYAAADAVAWRAVREAPGHASWRVQRDAWRSALMPASGEVVAGFGVQPSGRDRIAQWLGQDVEARAADGADDGASGVLTVVGLLWAGLNAALVVVAGLGLALLLARRRWGEVVCLSLLLGVTLTALVLGEGTRGAIGVLGLTACGWAASGLVLPRRAVVRRAKRRRKGKDGPTGIAGAGGLLSVAMAVNPGDEEGEERTRSWRNLWGWWSAGDRDSDNYRAVRLPLTGGQGLPVAGLRDEDQRSEQADTSGDGGKAIAPGVELLEESVEEETPLVAGGRPL